MKKKNNDNRKIGPLNLNSEPQQMRNDSVVHSPPGKHENSGTSCSINVSDTYYTKYPDFIEPDLGIDRDKSLDQRRLN